MFGQGLKRVIQFSVYAGLSTFMLPALFARPCAYKVLFIRLFVGIALAYLLIMLIQMFIEIWKKGD
jgi:antibiotic biosynthesis monooxygenase (ABM) superfamily enzyme